jgi:hypothetical protein
MNGTFRPALCRGPLQVLISSLIAASGAHAQAIAALGTEGVSFIAPGGDLYATYEGSSAGYFNQLFVGNGNTPVLSNWLTMPGTQTLLGSYDAGTELIFRMNATAHDNTVTDFFTGSANRNIDGLAHARVQYGWQEGATLVSFEDQLGLPEGPDGYNDLSFSLRSTLTVTPPAPPWPTEPPVFPPEQPPIDTPIEPSVPTPWPDTIAPIGTEGLSVIAPGGDLYLTYEGSGAGYTNQLFVNGLPNALVSNKTTESGSELLVGSFAAGTEVVFRMNTIDHDGNVFDYFTGAATRNSDGLAHARVQTGWRDGAILVSFEDMAGNPEGDAGFNDLSFSLRTQALNPIPEPGTLPLMALGLTGMLLARRGQRRTPKGS